MGVLRAGSCWACVLWQVQRLIIGRRVSISRKFVCCSQVVGQFLHRHRVQDVLDYDESKRRKNKYSWHVCLMAHALADSIAWLEVGCAQCTVEVLQAVKLKQELKGALSRHPFILKFVTIFFYQLSRNKN